MIKEKQIVSVVVVEGDVEKVIKIVPEYVDKKGVAHVSHINAILARKRDKEAEEDEKKVGE